MFDADLIHKNSNTKLKTMAGAVAFDTKAVSEDGTFEGYASTFNNVDNGGDKVLPGAFAKSISQKGVEGIKLLRDHWHDKVIGKLTSIKEDRRGLKISGKIFEEIELGKETLFLMREGVLNAMSIGYLTRKSEYDRQKDVRDLIDLDLWEVSVVPFPMNPKATINAVKSDDHSPRDIERILRDADLPKSFASLVAKHGVDKAKEILASKGVRGDTGNDDAIAAHIRAVSNSIKGN